MQLASRSRAPSIPSGVRAATGEAYTRTSGRRPDGRGAPLERSRRRGVCEVRPRGAGCWRRGPVRAPAGGSSLGEPGTWLSRIFVRGIFPAVCSPRNPLPSLCSPGQSHPLAFFFGTALCPPHGVICLLSLHLPSPIGHPPFAKVTHFVPFPPSLFTSPRVAFSEDAADGDAADPAARVCSPENPPSTFAPSPGAREASFRPVLSPVTGLGGGHGQGGGGRDGLAPEPPPLLASSRGLCLSPQVRRRGGGGGGGSWGRISIEINNQAAVINTGTWRPQPQPQLRRRRSAPTAAGT